MPFTIDQLRQHTPHHILGAVCLYPERSVILGNGQDWFAAEASLQGVEGLLLFDPPLPGLFPSQFMEGPGDFAEVPDEASIEVGKSKE